MVKNKNGFGFRILLISLLIITLVINFIGSYLRITHFYWHLFLHIGIIIFSFLILIYSLKLNEKAIKYIMLGCSILIIVNCILFLSHIFEEYFWLETNTVMILGMVLGIFLIMVGFKEAVK